MPSTMVRRAGVEAVLRGFGFDALEVALARRPLADVLVAAAELAEGDARATVRPPSRGAS